jgi:hypothetical protein
MKEPTKYVSPEAHRIAARVAASLFSNDAGERAAFLVLTAANGRRLGSWSEARLAHLIALSLGGSARPAGAFVP